MRKLSYFITVTIIAVIVPGFADTALAAGQGAPSPDGGQLSLWWISPFVGMLLSIALAPLLAPDFWHHHVGKVSLGWALTFLIPFSFAFGWEAALYELLHAALLEYIPFIILLKALYTVAGGVRLTGSLVGTPLANTVGIGLGATLASVMGTTGASMLLIRPLIRSIEYRRHKVHTIIFFIFLVSNIGGSLTPLGDPPLFLGFMKGVDFFWTLQHMFLPMLFVSIPLLLIYFLLDLYLHTKDPGIHPLLEGIEEKEPLRIEGKINLLLLICVVGIVLMGGTWKSGVNFEIHSVSFTLESLVVQALLLLVIILSLKMTHIDTREGNDFSWEPMAEVAKLFAAIFITITPAIAILKAGSAGALGDLIAAVNHNGQPVPMMYFWASGLLSSFLDNAPTYLIFFNAAGGDPVKLMTEYASTLTAISAGAVFMGANTYIGNAPNFMVKAIAQSRGIRMPSFFGYMLWSFGILTPLFGLTTWVFFL